jgi:2-polyprenyl-3-methyl-5-hydroxy-6-metoxy-1,4-benzoquinol methylase
MNKKTEKELLGLVEKNYKQIAEHYNETRKRHLQPLWNKLVKYAENIKEGASILDVGCGNGRLIEAFENKKINYIGIDQNEKLIELAKKQKPGYKFAVGDLCKLGRIAEYDFDYLISIAVLHHLPGKRLRVEALKQCRNKINADGEIFITVWNMWSPKWQKKKFRQNIFKFFLLKLIGKNKMDFGDILIDWKNSEGQVISQRYYHAFTKRELKKLTRAADLKIKKIYKDKYNYYLVASK